MDRFGYAGLKNAAKMWRILGGAVSPMGRILDGAVNPILMGL